MNEYYVTSSLDLPINVPRKKGHSGTLMTGDVMLINQFGRNGVIRRNIM